MRFSIRSGFVVVAILTGLCMVPSAPSTAIAEGSTGSELGDGPLSGPRWGRPPLTGDWFGGRKWLADHGLTLGLDVVNVVQGIADGGFDSDTENDGSLYLEAHFDTQKAGLWPGGFVDFRLEKSYGESVIGKTGTLLGGNMVGLFPDGDDKTAVISKFMVTQFLAEWAGVFIGRTDTADGDGNHFAAGRGRTQFMNPRIIFLPLAAVTTPYVINAVGALVLTPSLAEGHPGILQLLVGDPQVQPDESGFDDDFFDEQLVAAEYHVPTRFFDRPGAQHVSFTYNTIERIKRGELLNVILPGVEPARDDTWTLAWNFHQYLHVRDGQDSATQGYDPNTPQLEGFGVFGRAGFTTDDVNPSDGFLAAGLAGRGLGEFRRNDTYGAGVTLTFLNGDTDIGALNLRDEAWAFELYYNAELAPWLHVTPDFQLMEPITHNLDTAVVLGLRVKVDL